MYVNLTKEEHRRLKKVLRSPIYNKEDALVRLFECLSKSKELPEPKKAFSQVFGDKKFDMGSYYALKSRLYQMMLRFLKLEQLEHRPVEAEIKLLEVFREKKLDAFFFQTLKKAKKKLEQSSERNSNFHFYQYRLEWEQFEMKGRETRIRQTNLQPMTNDLNSFFMAETLRWAVVMESHKAVYNSEYFQPFLPKVLELCEQEEYLKIPAVSMYYFCYKALVEPQDENHFLRLKELIKKQGQLFPTHELTELYTIAINYGVKKLNIGREDYLHILFDLYRSGLENGIFFKDGILSRWTYTNIITIALRISELEWCRKFIETHKKYLEKPFAENSYHYNLARYYYYRKKYEKAMPLLVQTQLDDVLLHLSSKVLLLKMYYELNEYDALDFLLNSMASYLNRNKVISYHKKNYSNIVQLSKKIIAINQFDKREIDRLKNKIENTEILTERKWFIEQVEKLK